MSMNAPAPAAPDDVLDLAALNDLKDMLGDALAEIAQGFLDGLDGEIGAVAVAMNQDTAAVRAAAHSLKGSAGTMGARLLSGQASAMETAALEGQMAVCRQMLPDLQNAAGKARVALQAYIAQA
jgi:HPt (histidine-containing phosphotransfer) domain-containing protein